MARLVDEVSRRLLHGHSRRNEAEHERVMAAFDRLASFEESLSYNDKERFKYGDQIEEGDRLRNELEQEEFWLAVQNAEVEKVWVAMPEHWCYPSDFDDLAVYAVDDSLTRKRMLEEFDRLFWQPGWKAAHGQVYASLYWNGTVVENALVMTDGERERMDSLIRKDRTDFKLFAPIGSVERTDRKPEDFHTAILERQNTGLLPIHQFGGLGGPWPHHLLWGNPQGSKDLLPRRIALLPDHPIFASLSAVRYDELFDELARWSPVGTKLQCPYPNGDLLNLKDLSLSSLHSNPNRTLAEWFVSNKGKQFTAASLGRTSKSEGGVLWQIVKRLRDASQ